MTSTGKSPTSNAGTASTLPASSSQTAAPARSTPGQSSSVTTPLSTSASRPRPTPTSASILAPAPLSALAENQDEILGDSSGQTNAMNVSAGNSISQDDSPAVSTARPPLESSAGPSHSNLSHTTSARDTAGHENSTDVVPVSGTSKNSAPAKKTRKSAAKKTPKPKEMTDGK